MQETSSGNQQGGDENACKDFPPWFFEFDVTMQDGNIYGCTNSLAQEEVQAEGIVTDASSEDTWVIDTCPPTADCLPSLVKVAVRDGSKLAIPAGAMVSVAFKITSLGGVCESSLLVKNLPSWDGLTNPVATDEAPWFDTVGSEGSPFALEHVAYCGSEGGEDGCSHSYYKLIFTLKEEPSVATGEIAIGESASWSVPSGTAKGSYTVHNVSSESSSCEIPGHEYAWVSRNP